MQGAAAAVVRFDDLATPNGSVFVPGPYAGFIWGENIGTPGLIAIADAHWTGSGNYNNVGNGSPSGENAVLGTGGVKVRRFDGGHFSFDGAYFSPFTSNNDYPDSQGSTAKTLIVSGYRDTLLVGSVSLGFERAGYVWLPADLDDLTHLVISGQNPAIPDFATRWAMDDFTYNSPPAAVPEPASSLLLSGALLALLGVRGRRQAG
jgi:hypothetical protein